MRSLPLRGPEVRELGLALPPAPLPAWRAGRPRKRWRYVGVYTPELMLCVGDARIGPVPQRWWAVALPGGALHERTTFGAGGIAVDAPWNGDAGAAPASASDAGVDGEGRATPGTASRVHVEAGDVRIELELEESRGMEIVSPIGDRGAYAWTRKQACVPVRGTVEVDGTRHAIDGDAGFVDDSAGYHARHTAWNWSAGVGRTTDGRRVGWNLVSGIHDDPAASERTLWVDGESRHVGAVTFDDDLSAVAGDGVDLRFDEWSRREHSTNALIMSSSYSQPFGAFGGQLADDLQLAEGYGVMEDHDVRW
jgi:hypothetical protein